MGTPDDTKQEVLRATDIVLVVEQYVALTRSGRTYKALCPFHTEKTPSFNVSPERQTFKCFGCGKGGNAIDFLIEKEGLDFKAALRLLADRAGIRLPERGRGAAGADGGAAAARLDAFELQRHAQDFFRRCFMTSKAADHAREYVASRGIDEESAEKFGIGYAPDGWGFLLRFLRNRGFDEAAAERAGLALPRRDKNGFIDRFRGRLMFPIHDTMGRVLGFGGRALKKEDNPKYLNSPETAIFKKREVVYGLHLAKDAARERGEVAVVEGYTDAILAHQAGFPWFVATLGTAFGGEHAKMLSRIAQRLLVFFDGDAAGASANRRGLVEAGRAGIALFKELKVALLPEGLDPADLIVQRGAGALKASVEGAVSLSDFFYAAAGATTAERAKALDEVCEVLSSLDEETYRELEIGATAHRFGVEEDVIRRRVKHFRQAAMNKSFPAASNAGSGKRSETQSPVTSVAPDALEKVERWMLECLIGAPELVQEAMARVPLSSFRDSRAKAIAEALYGGRPVSELEDEPARRLAADVVAGIDPAKSYAREWRGVVARLLDARNDDVCTKDGQDELKDSVTRKLRRLGLQGREMSLDSGERAGERQG